MKRRSWLQATTAAGAGSLLSSWFPRTARAESFGKPPEALQSRMLPEAKKASQILEIFLYGGVSTWESFYCIPEYGQPDNPIPELRNTQFYTFYHPNNQALPDALLACGDQGTVWKQAFASDSLGKLVHLGPYVRLLGQRADIVQRMRIVVTKHALEPHEAAIPLALCGHTLGTPQMTSLGAHIQRYFLENTQPVPSWPMAYGLTNYLVPNDNLQAAVATGLHPGWARPWLVRLESSAQLSTLLSRPSFSSIQERKRADSLAQWYGQQALQQSRFPGEPTSSSPHVKALVQTLAGVEQAPAIQELFPSSSLVPVSESLCATTALNWSRIGIQQACRLLTDPHKPARYCLVMDSGLVAADGGGGYDTHVENPYTQALNLKNLCQELLENINLPGEKNATKIDLDKTMVVFTMEFGRSPQAQGELGRNHWPYGYVTVYLGGPIGPAESGVYGAIDERGFATTYIQPSEARIACLLAMGIWPFSPEGFGVGDVQNASDESEALSLVLSKVLGYS
jgi:hypothetical protein